MPQAEYFLVEVTPPVYVFSCFLLMSYMAVVFLMLKGRRPRKTGEAAMALAKEVVIKLCCLEAFDAIVGRVVAMPAASPESYDIYDAHLFLIVATLAYFRSEEAFLEFEVGDLLECLRLFLPDFF